MERKARSLKLVVTDNNVKTAIGRLEKAIIWRRTQRVDDVEEVAEDLDEDVGERVVGANVADPHRQGRRLWIHPPELAYCLLLSQQEYGCLGG